MCGDRTKVLEIWGFSLKIVIIFSELEKGHLNSIGLGAEFRSLRTQKKNPLYIKLISTPIGSLYQ